MAVSIYRPTCAEDFKKAVKQAQQESKYIQLECLVCRKPFTDENVHTSLGWRETQISGFCESCWDDTFGGDE